MSPLPFQRSSHAVDSLVHTHVASARDFRNSTLPRLPPGSLFSDQLLMEAAETRWHGVLGDMFRSVPHALWRLASHTGSLLPQEEPSRSPGSMFVEAGGANGALAQAMLTLVFRIIRCGGKPGSLVAPSRVNTGLWESSLISSETQGGYGCGGGQEERTAATTRPWTTAAEALAATAATTAVGDQHAESWLGFAGRLVRLFSDQDDALVNMLLTNLYIFHDTRSLVSPSVMFFECLSSPQRLDGLPFSTSESWLEQDDTFFFYIMTGGFSVCCHAICPLFVWRT